MSKLLKLKSWLTIEDAAKRLSISAGEKVSQPDILRLALEGHLRLSVYFVNHGRARMGKVVPWRETRWRLIKPIFEGSMGPALNDDDIASSFPEHLQKLWRETSVDFREICRPMMTSLTIEEGKFLNLEKEVVELTGIWDLPMIGTERLDVEHEYQQLTGGPEVTLQGLDGAFVSQGEEVICQLQESWDQNPYQKGSLASFEKLKAAIFGKTISKKRSEQLLQEHEEDRVNFLETSKSQPEKDNYFPAGGLPKDAVLVVRATALSELENQLTVTEEKPEKPLDVRERRSAGQVIAALAAMAKLDLTTPYAADETLRKSAAHYGLDLPASTETVVKFLTAATKNNK